MNKIAILFSGTGSNFAYIVETLHGQGYEVVVALTNNPNAKGIQVAKDASIPLEIIDSKSFVTREDFDTVVVKTLQKYTVDLTVLAGFMRILTSVFTLKIKSINLHPSLLPRHKGLHAIQKSYDDNYEEGGVSIHYVSSELDGGEIILQKRVSKIGMSFEMYDTRIRQLEKIALVEAIQYVFETKNGTHNAEI